MGGVVEDADDETFKPTCISESTGPPPARRINTVTRAIQLSGESAHDSHGAAIQRLSCPISRVKRTALTKLVQFRPCVANAVGSGFADR